MVNEFMLSATDHAMPCRASQFAIFGCAVAISGVAVAWTIGKWTARRATSWPSTRHDKYIRLDRHDQKIGEEDDDNPVKSDIKRLQEDLPIHTPAGSCGGGWPQLPQPVEQTHLRHVTTSFGLRAVASSLAGLDRFGVDLEHGVACGYTGRTCLMQIYTGSEDILIDALLLRDHMHILRAVFADPCIQKVLHGSDNDLLWLQRDFGIHLVNLFDTAVACQELQWARHSMDHLLDHLCNQQEEKGLQTADWTQRPLPAAMIEYARLDAHYLLYLQDLLCLLLRLPHPPASAADARSLLQDCRARPAAAGDADRSLGAARLRRAARRAQSMTLARYRAPSRAAAALAAMRTIMRRRGTKKDAGAPSRTRRGGEVLRDCVHALCRWRDELAYEMDVPPASVLSDAQLLQLACNHPSHPVHLLTIVASARQADGTGSGTVDRPESAEAGGWVMKGFRNPHDTWSERERLQGGVRGRCSEAPGIWLPGWSWRKMFLVAAAFLTGRLSWTVLTHSCRICQLLQDAMNGQLVLDAPAASSKPKRPVDAKAAERKRVRYVEKFRAKGPVYENCCMLSMDGELLCHCDRKKMEWYFSRGLADRVDDNTIRLTFEHQTSDQQAGEGDFYSQSKANRCVACGEDSHYLRYRILPGCYRKHFPTHMKSHRSHDVVLLCVDCHEVAHRAAEQLKKELAADIGVPLLRPKVPAPHAAAGSCSSAEDGQSTRGCRAGAGSASSSTAMHPLNVRRAAITLERYGEKLPPGRRRQLEAQLLAFLGHDVPADDVVTAADSLLAPGDVEAALLAGLSQRRRAQAVRRFATAGRPPPTVAAAVDTAGGENAAEMVEGGHQWHGREVVSKLMQQGGTSALHELLRRFRQGFVDELQPRFLPKAWAVGHDALREYGQFSVYHGDELVGSGSQPAQPADIEGLTSLRS